MATTGKDTKRATAVPKFDPDEARRQLKEFLDADQDVPSHHPLHPLSLLLSAWEDAQEVEKRDYTSRLGADKGVGKDEARTMLSVGSLDSDDDYMLVHTRQALRLFIGRGRDPEGKLARIPDASVLQQRRVANAMEACRLLVVAESMRGLNGPMPGAYEQSLVETAYRLARMAVDGHPTKMPEPPRPRVVVGVEGGLVQGASSDIPVDLVVVDYDMNEEAAGAIAVPQSGGSTTMATIISHGVDLDPDFVAGVWQAESEG